MGKKVVAYLALDKELVPYSALFNAILGKRDSKSAEPTLHIEVCPGFSAAVCGFFCRVRMGL